MWIWTVWRPQEKLESTAIKLYEEEKSGMTVEKGKEWVETIENDALTTCARKCSGKDRKKREKILDMLSVFIL